MVLASEDGNARVVAMPTAADIYTVSCMISASGVD